MSVLVKVFGKVVNKLCIEQTDGTISQVATPHPQLSGDGIPDIYLSFDICETETDDSSDDDIEWEKQIEGGHGKYTKYKKYRGSTSSDTDDGKHSSHHSSESAGGNETDHEKRHLSFLKQRKLRMADYCMPTHTIGTSRGSSFFSSNRSNYTSEYTETEGNDHETDGDMPTETK
eukprot:CAMPEP_0201570382 /NCGR_PEP_ID=MMETSP0190_2-20130828/12621_1 /ASSEMBLY_ACC=CAM_ASM_000263 /TAXON_ID=37353 /ORGANISM="Rosalina sp." /LENGTH=173 /DNA_ID=CAMNT_0047993859 /DNA_START=37 /DNA_END=558 /DNA_ORIENTATION=-